MKVKDYHTDDDGDEISNYYWKQRAKMDKEIALRDMEADFIKGLRNIELGDVCAEDMPDFSDAYVVSADRADGTPLTEDELDKLNEEYPEIAQNNAYDWLLD